MVDLNIHFYCNYSYSSAGHFSSEGHFLQDILVCRTSVLQDTSVCRTLHSEGHFLQDILVCRTTVLQGFFSEGIFVCRI